MIDLGKGGRLTKWRYVRVSWPDMAEVGQVAGIQTHSTSENVNTSLKVDGSVSYTNMPDLGDDLLRIYADMSLGGEVESLCCGTFRVATGTEEIEEGIRTGTGDLYSMLSVPDMRLCEETETVVAGGNFLAKATQLLSACELHLVATPCDKTASDNHSWDTGTSYLEIINDIMEIIGYGSADVDEYGNVILAPYIDPSDKTASESFSDTEPDVSDRSFTCEFNRFDVPNVVVVTSTSSEVTIRAVAENSDPLNPYSTTARRMRITRCEEVADLTNQEEAQAKADALLKTSMMQVETIVIGHAGKRFGRGDAIQMDYQRSGFAGKYSATKRSVKGTPDMASETSMRRSVRLYGSD